MEGGEKRDHVLTKKQQRSRILSQKKAGQAGRPGGRWQAGTDGRSSRQQQQAGSGGV
jgi:hypothetical protein